MAGREIDFSQIKKKRGRRRRYVRIFLFLALFSAVLYGSWWLVFRSPVFRVARIAVEGTSQISKDEVIQFLTQRLSFSSRARFFGLENMFGWPNGVSENDLKLLPTVSEIRIGKRYGERTIAVEVKEREPVGIWCVKKDAADVPSGKLQSPVRCAWFDSDGTAFRESIEAEGSLLTAVSDYSSSTLSIGSKVLPEKFIPNLLSIIKVASAIDLPVSEIRLNDLNSQEIEVRIGGGPVLYFSLRFPADSALPVIQKLLSSQGQKKIEYIDFRAENRAYYK